MVKFWDLRPLPCEEWLQKLAKISKKSRPESGAQARVDITNRLSLLQQCLLGRVAQPKRRGSRSQPRSL
jgi:hypothetical protein